MSVAGDGNDAGSPDMQDPVPSADAPVTRSSSTPRSAASSSAARRPRHRVPPTATASAKVPALPEPFSPSKPTIPSIPRRRRRGGPTAIATVTVPVGSPEELDPDQRTADTTALLPLVTDPDDALDTPPDVTDPATVSTLAGEARANAAANVEPADHATDDPADLSADRPDAEEPSAAGGPTIGAHAVSDTDGLEFIVTLPSTGSHPPLSNEPTTTPTASAPAAAASALASDPPPAGAEPDSEMAAASTGSEVGVPDDLDEAAASDAAGGAEPAPESESESGSEAGPVDGEPPVAATATVADDSPTVADHVAPAFAIITDHSQDDAIDYRGSRRKATPWQRYPVGALAVTVLILLITGTVAFQLVGADRPDEPSNDRVPAVPGASGLPGGPGVVDSPSPSPSATAGSAAPIPSASRANVGSPAANRSASPSPTGLRTTAQPAPPPLTNGRLVGAGSNKCIEYRAGDRNRVVLDDCDGRSNQHWVLQGDGTLRADGGCLDVTNAGTGNGTAVQLFQCNGTPAQKWTPRGDGTWMNPNANRCLDAADGGTGSGTQIVIWSCSGAANQRWTMRPF